MLKARVKLRVPAGQAKPSPAIGQALGSLGVNMMDFCKAFNEKSMHYKIGLPMRVQMRVMSDSTFDFNVLSPPTTWFLKRAAGISKGTATPGHAFVGSIHVKQLYEIAKYKQQDPNLKHLSLENVAKCITASCHSLGLRIDRRTDEQRGITFSDEAIAEAVAAAEAAAAAEKGQFGEQPKDAEGLWGWDGEDHDEQIQTAAEAWAAKNK